MAWRVSPISLVVWEACRGLNENTKNITMGDRRGKKDKEKKKKILKELNQGKNYCNIILCLLTTQKPLYWFY